MEQLPEAEAVAATAEPVVVRPWQVGDRARSRSGGWEGRIAALERGGKRVTLEAGGMRVTVGAEDLVPALEQEPSRRVAGGRARRTSARFGSVARSPWPRRSTCAGPGSTRRSTRSAATSTTPRWRVSARSSIIHGMGTGALRDAVRTEATSHPLVKSMRPGERGEGGDGATIVEL